MKNRRFPQWLHALAALAMLAVAAPSLAQFSDSYNFLKAVKDKDGAKLNEFIDSKGASTIINTRDYNSGEGALAIVVKRRDDQWLRFLLAKGANPNVKDNAGNTPLILAAQISFAEGIASLIDGRANVNLRNSRGETPLIVAVQRRDIQSVRLLLASGADAGIPDNLAGMSARDYAERDNRSTAILKMIDEAAKNKATKQATISGPKL